MSSKPSSMLKDSLFELGCQNFESRCFIPVGILEEILSTDTVRSVVEEWGIEPYKQLDLIQRIDNGGRKTLAILIAIDRAELFIKLVELDQDSVGIDAKLPFNQSVLGSILSLEAAREFDRAQWKFLAPSFGTRVGHRIFDSRTILPFLQTERLGEGAFGTVRLVTIHPNHNTFEETRSSTTQPLKDRPSTVRPKVILKQYKGRANGDREIRALSILRSLKHPNNIELLGSYTLKETDNLLFPALSGDLGQLLACNESPSDFQAEADYLFGLSGLASAIEALHDYVVDALGIKLVGIHNNIKPTNILVDYNRFVLAGFGCSEFLQNDEGVCMANSALGDYLAPECENLQTGMPGRAGRASDIWAFGCLLAEVGTYMLAGQARGVQEFGHLRLAWDGLFVHRFFFSETGPHFAVMKWLANLQRGSSRTATELLRLTTDMLDIEPQNRPTAKRVKQRLEILALSSRVKTVGETYIRIAADFGKEMRVESKIFMLVTNAAGFADQELPLFESSSTFIQWAYLLQAIEERLAAIDQDHEYSHTTAISLRTLNSLILKLLSSSTQIKVESQIDELSDLEKHTFRFSQESNGYSRLESTRTSFDHSGPLRDESYSTLASSLSLKEQIDKGNPDDSDDFDDRIVSVVSDQDDIGSQISTGKSMPEMAAEDHLALILARNESLRSLYEEAFTKVGRVRFVENFRRLLKRWYLDLLPYGSNNLEKATLGMLKSRRNRTKIAQRVVDIYTPKSDEAEADIEDGLEENIPGKTRLLEDWIANNPGLASHPPPIDVEEEQEHDNDLSSDGEDSVLEGDAGEVKDTKYVEEMESFLIDGEAFRKLLMNLQIFLLPVSLHFLVRDILSIPSEHVWLSSEEDYSIANRLKNFVEQITQQNWIWWPFQPKMRFLQPGETRLCWKCHCNSTRWKELSKADADKIKYFLTYKGPKLQQEHPCQMRRRKKKFSFKTIVGAVQQAANTANGHNSWFGTGSTASSSQVGQLGSGARRSQSQAQITPQPQQSTIHHQQSSQNNINMPQTRELRVLFGVEGSRRTLEVAQIDVLKYNQDEDFFIQVKKEYKQHRGFSRYWFSCWRFNYCTFVKLLKYRRNRVILLGEDLPTNTEYEYDPRPPHTQLPHVMPHLFELALSPCYGTCILAPFHDCVEPPDGKYFLNYTPKRTRLLELNKDGQEHVWGLQAQHSISLMYIVFYHVLIVVGTLGFWAWRMQQHPNDLQNAAVPFTMVTVSLSLFWSSAGILKIFREPT